MKKSKILCLVICTLMIVTVIPAVGLPTTTGVMKNFSATQPRNQPPTPAYASIPPADALLDLSHALDNKEITASTMDDVVVSIIEQIDEPTFLSYEQNLTANGPRATESPACVAAADYIYNQFVSFGLSAQLVPWSYAGYDSDNVEATLPGTDESSDEIYIICAHYDTVSAGVGADDDTSGTVAVLIAAQIMSQYQFNHTIKFVCFSGEEQGLLGSAVYASNAASQGWNIVGVLNCDMISYAVTTNDGHNLILFENTASEWLYTYLVGVNTEYDAYIDLVLDHGGYTWGSDHNSFWDEGYDALFFFEYTETPYYHTAQDTIAHINLTYAVKTTRLILAALAELAEAGMLSNPPATPVLTGPNTGVIDELYTYQAVATDPDSDNVFYYFDWGDGSNSGWLGPFTSGQEGTAQKSWSATGTYTVRAKARDIYHASSGWSTPIMMEITTDHAPNTPTLTGPAEGKPGNSYKYSLTTTDLDGDMVFYYIDWGDNTSSGWIGPYNSGATASANHQWAAKGTYTVQAKAKDIYNVESGWATLEVTMPLSVVQHQSTQLQLFYQFLQSLALKLTSR